MIFELDQYNRNTPDAELIADVQRVASLLGKSSLTGDEYEEHSRFSRQTLIRRFGTWNKSLVIAGLSTSKLYGIPDEELFENIEKLWVRLGRQPHVSDLRSAAESFGATTYIKRFGSWRKALQAFVAYVNEEETPLSEDAIKGWKIEPTTKHKTPRDINSRLRVRVLVRDSGTCQICGRSWRTNPDLSLQVDHIKAYAKGGETVMENLQTLCFQCNNGKSDLDLYSEQDSEETNVKA